MNTISCVAEKVYEKYPNDIDIWQLLQGCIALEQKVKGLERQFDYIKRLIEIGRNIEQKGELHDEPDSPRDF